MSDNNADFNGTGQINNPASDDATQADFTQQSYGTSQADAQMFAQNSQSETPTYDPNAAYTQPAQPTYDQPAYAQQPAAPAYDPNAASYNQYAQPAQQPNYTQPAAPAPTYDPNAYGQQGYAAPAYDANGAYSQSARPDYTQPNYGQPSYNQQGYAAPAYNQSAYAQPNYAQQPNYTQPAAPAGYSQKSKLAAGLLGIFLGSLGVHNFYLGNTGKAIAQLLLTLIGWIIIIGPAISGIWGLVEGILILCSSYGSQWHRDGRGVELQD